MAEEVKVIRDVKDDLDHLENNIKRLKIEYEQYFMHILKREPQFLRGQVEKTIAFYSNYHIRNTADKFRFRNLADKYNSFKQYWVRTLNLMESDSISKCSESNVMDQLNPSVAPRIDISTNKPPQAQVTQGRKEIDNEIRRLYNTYIEEIKKINGSTTGITYALMKNAVTSQRKKAERKYGTSELDFQIKSSDGRVKVQIRPKK